MKDETTTADAPYTVKEVAHRMNLSTQTILRAITNKRLPAYKLGERKWGIAPTDFNAWVAEGAPTSPVNS